MQLVLHAGAHFTEEERLMKCLLRNKDAFQKHGVAVPGPGKYRNLLRETMVAMENSPIAENARDVMIDAILDGQSAERLLLSSASFFGIQRGILRKGLLYPMAAERMAYMAQIFRKDEIELFMAIRNPASFLPAAFQHSPRDTMEGFMSGMDPLAVRWSDTLLRIREAAPEVSVTVWCNEDAPLIWTEIIQEMAGFDDGEEVIGGYDLLADIMAQEGMDRFQRYMASRTELSVAQKRRVIIAFLEKFARIEAIEEELDMPGWTQELVTEMTEVYEEDMVTLARIPGVHLVSP